MKLGNKNSGQSQSGDQKSSKGDGLLYQDGKVKVSMQISFDKKFEPFDVEESTSDMAVVTPPTQVQGYDRHFTPPPETRGAKWSDFTVLVLNDGKSMFWGHEGT